MTEKVIITIITCIVSAVMGYLINLVKTAKKKNKSSDIALRTLLQNTLTNTYFVYEKMGKIPDYIYKNWLNLLAAYEGLGGDDYIHILAEHMKAWEIEHTGILE